MRPHRFDPDDPFGSQPDEKPPAGWDDSLWDEVRARIERAAPDPGPPDPPVPPPPPERRRNVPVLMALIIPVLLFAASRIHSRGGPPRQDDDSAARTVVHVVGVDHPDVAVEWARRGGRRAGYVVLESLDPQVSCIVIEASVPGS
jgi:hypothetical protein